MPLISFGHRTLSTDGGFVLWFAASTAWCIPSNHWLVERPPITVDCLPSKTRVNGLWLGIESDGSSLLPLDRENHVSERGESPLEDI